jgi:hypothetical protein
MKLKVLLSVLVIGSLALGGAFGQAQKKEITGTVVAVTDTSITVRQPNDTQWVWEIKRGAGTATSVTGKAKIGATVKVIYAETDAQKKEAPL